MAILDAEKFLNSISGIGQYSSKLGRGQLVEKIRDIHNFERLIKELRIISQGTSKAKDALVTGLIQLKYIVAVTGDDTADFQIIQKAQVGIGLGLSGNEVVKQAADIILKNDNFSSIIPAILYSRNIYEFIRKYFQLILSQNYVIIFILFIHVFFSNEFHPFNSAQFLFLNILVDDFAAYIMVREEPSQQLLKEPPLSQKEYIITSEMWKNIIFQTFFQIMTLCFLLFMDLNYYLNLDDFFSGFYDLNQGSYLWNVRYTICFNCLVYLQLFNILCSTCLQKNIYDFYNFFWNKAVFLIQIGFFLVIYLIVFSYFGKYLGCVQLKFGDHLFCLVLGIINIVIFIFINQFSSNFFIRFNYLKYTFSQK
ncbi:hypothetical protein IMG5_204810 [Ichthyophthirius multifiliis]|uniref:Cation-transporting P-type ATPase C-terminal domain-containing protein n=1 Tax=Ichthyophthirius multifiliis TaxID=5932 RepID=G0R6I1_ICHMU|nr:hypothetical protein IMG5_204810 [Ichthyophthirius multifiliis]EGR26923.1 hypothetical protein IMG5_204810 [Ichthyophthirius multifiliis]|eukprot:XP_004023807.1 hypothetical protein IMG5_204810 [Ichthyophthirius multifiliis]